MEPKEISYSTQHSEQCVADIISILGTSLSSDPYWAPALKELSVTEGAQVHLGVFIEPYLQLIIEGKKTLESRFSINRSAPYCKVNQGDILLLKRSGGPIVGVCRIIHSWSYTLDVQQWAMLKTQHAKALCIDDPAFWERKQKSKYATLMQIRHVQALDPSILFKKSDRRGWIVLNKFRPEK